MVFHPIRRTASIVANRAGGLLPHLFTLALKGRFVSVALSFGSHQLGVTQRPALRSPDFPLPDKRSGHLEYSRKNYITRSISCEIFWGV